MVSQQMLISVALPVAAMAIIVGSVANVQNNTLAPGLDAVDAATQFGYPDVTIGEDPDKANSQLRGLTVFNMLSAQNCLYGTMAYNRKGELREEDQEFYDNLEDAYQPLEKVEHRYEENNTPKPVSELGESQLTYFREEDVLRSALALEDFDGACFGGKQLSITESLREHNEVLDTAMDISEGVHAAMPWNLAIGPSADNEELNRGALQGRFGRIEFETDSTILVDEPQLMGLRLNDAVTASGFNKEDAPDFIRGARAAVFVPEGYLAGEAAGAWDGQNPGQLSEDIASLGIIFAGTGAGTQAGTAAGVTVGVVAMAAGVAVTGPVGIIAAGVVGGIAGGYYGYTASSNLADELNIGSHPGILIGVDQQTKQGEDGWYSGKGMYAYRKQDNVDWREDLNAFRVRMVNFPTVMDNSFSEEDARNINDASLQLGYNYITKRSNYVLCNQSRGFIQSNAGREIEYDGKKKYQNEGPIFRDVVYPRIEQTNYESGCIADAKWSRSGDYHEMGRFKSHVDFLNEDDEFAGPKSAPITFIPPKSVRTMKMRNDDQKISKIDVDNALVLDPETKVTLKQGLEFVWPKDIGYDWWRPSDPVYYPDYRVSDQQCNEYDGVYDVTRMFTDNRESSMFYESLEGSGPLSYELVEPSEGDYRVEMYSDSGTFSSIPLTYNFDRFNAERITTEFELDIKNVETTDQSAYQQLMNQDVNFVEIFLDNPSSDEIKFLWTTVAPGKAGMGRERLNNPDTETKSGNIFYQQEATETQNLIQVAQNFEGTNSEGKMPVPEERMYRLVVDKESDSLILRGRFGAEKSGQWVTLIDRSFTEDEATMTVDSADRLEIKTFMPITDEDEPRAQVNLDEVTVEGTITGCP